MYYLSLKKTSEELKLTPRAGKKMRVFSVENFNFGGKNLSTKIVWPKIEIVCFRNAAKVPHGSCSLGPRL